MQNESDVTLCRPKFPLSFYQLNEPICMFFFVLACSSFQQKGPQKTAAFAKEEIEFRWLKLIFVKDQIGK